MTGIPDSLAPRVAAAPPPRSRLGRFLRTLRSTYGVIGVVAATAPFLLKVIGFDLAPPSPPSASGTASAAAIVAFLGSFLLFDASNRKFRRITCAVFALVTLVCLVVWPLQHARVVVTTSDGTFRAVRGFDLTPEARRDIETTVVPSDARSLFGHYGWESGDRIWTDVPTSTSSVFIPFLGFFVGLSIAAIGIAVDEMKRRQP